MLPQELDLCVIYRLADQHSYYSQIKKSTTVSFINRAYYSNTIIIIYFYRGNT